MDNAVCQQSWMTHLREGLHPSLRNGPGVVVVARKWSCESLEDYEAYRQR